MARKLKPQKVDTFRDDSSGLVTDIFLDRNRLDFFAFVQGARFRERSVDGLKCSIRKHLDEGKDTGYEWRKIIIIETEPPGSSAARISLEFEVDTIAKKPFAPGFASRIDGFDDDDPVTIVHFNGKSVSDPRTGYYVLPYSDEAMDGLRAIESAIRETKRKLDAIVGSEDSARLLAALASTGGNLLTEGST